MKPSPRIEAWLKKLGAAHRVRTHAPTHTLAEAAAAANVPRDQMLRAVVLEDDRGVIMAIVQADTLIDFNALSQQLGRELQPAPRERLATLFPDCEPGSIPPMAKPYGMAAVIDEQVDTMAMVCFEPGSREHLFQMAGATFSALQADARRGRFSRPTETLAGSSVHSFTQADGPGSSEGLKGLHNAEDLSRRLEQVEALPPMPETTRRLLLLRNNPKATIGELTAVVSLDPALAAQIVRYARSAYYGYRSKVDNLNDAITRILGFDLVLHIALGLSASKALRIPADGPLGLESFWRHSTYTAAMVQALNTQLPPAIRCKPGLAYLAGLLHDFGFLLLGHQFKSEFFLLNKAVEANPDVPVTLVEKRLLGIEHHQFGARLLENWDMPPEVVVAARQHHNEYYSGEHAPYAHLVLLAEHLLKGHMFSDAAGDEPPPVVLTALGLNLEQIAVVTDQLLTEASEGLDDMSRILAA